MTSVRHILSLSGGKDSSALAVYMRERVPEMEYVFCDTGKELPETYEYLDRLEAYLGKQIVRLNPERTFEHYLHLYRGVLPDARTRWCTRMLKIRPFEKYVGEDPVINYVGIRADECRTGYLSTKPNIKARYPFVEDGIDREGVHRILRDAGLGVPEYYRWRSRSGCYFCFFQQRIEWLGLHREHPDLFEAAMRYEDDLEVRRHYGARPSRWNGRERLADLIQPDRRSEIERAFARRIENGPKHATSRLLSDVLEDDMATGERPCLICEL